MKISLIEGIIFATGAALLVAVFSPLLSATFGPLVVAKLITTCICVGYVTFLLRKLVPKTGSLTFITLTVALLAGMTFVGSGWSKVVLVGVSCIWLVRCFVSARSFLSGVLHGVVCIIGLSGAIWTLFTTGSFAVAVWSFFLIQAASSWVPDRICASGAKNVNKSAVRSEIEVEKRFDRAFRAADSALSQLARST